MAAVGLAFALRTVEVRRSNDVKGVQEPGVVEESRPVPPAEWPGVGYLPDDVQAIAGIRVAAALKSPAGRLVLDQVGVVNGDKPHWLGIAPARVEHLLFGASLRALPPRVTTILHGRDPLPAAEPTTTQHGKQLRRGRLWANGPDGVTWRPKRHMLVATVLPEDMERVPSESRADVGRFTAPLPELLKEKLDPTALAWLVAAVDGRSPAFGLVASQLPLPQAGRDAVGKLDAFAASARADGQQVSLALHLRGRDGAGEAAAAAITESLTKAGVPVTQRADGDWRQVTATAEAEKLAAWIRGK
jgi:hypothetical protein